MRNNMQRTKENFTILSILFIDEKPWVGSDQVKINEILEIKCTHWAPNSY